MLPSLVRMVAGYIPAQGNTLDYTLFISMSLLLPSIQLQNAILQLKYHQSKRNVEGTHRHVKELVGDPLVEKILKVGCMHSLLTTSGWFLLILACIWVILLQPFGSLALILRSS